MGTQSRHIGLFSPQLWDPEVLPKSKGVLRATGPEVFPRKNTGASSSARAKALLRAFKSNRGEIL